jgi:hypothetical protein
MPALRRLAGSWVLFGLGLLAGARLRWLHLAQLRPTPFWDTLVGDAAQHHAWAARYAAGDWRGPEGPFFVDPLYPWVLGLVEAAGGGLLAARALNLALSVATAAALGLLARRLVGPAWGTLAVWSWAHLRPDVFNVGEVEKTTLGLALLAGALLALSVPRRGAVVAAGVLLGLGALARGHLLVLLPALAGLLAFEDRHGRRALALLAGAALAIAPVTLRNRLVGGEWVLTTTGLGANLYLSYCPGCANGYTELPFVRADARFEEAEFRREAERRAGRGLTATETSGFWRAAAFDAIAKDPGGALAHLGARLRLALADFELGDTLSIDALARFAPVLALPLPGFGALVPLAVLGLVAARRRRELWAVAVTALTLWAAVASFFVLARFRVFLAPALLILSVAGARWLAEQLAARAAAKAATGAFAVLATAALVAWPPPEARLAKVVDPVPLARVFASRGLMGDAERLLREALAAGPTHPAPRCALAELLVASGRWVEAGAAVEACAAAAPEARGLDALRGQVAEAEGRPGEARRAYQRQLARTPDDEATRARLEALPAP